MSHPSKARQSKAVSSRRFLYKDVSVNYDDANGQARQSFQSGFSQPLTWMKCFTLQFEISDSAGNNYLSPRQK